MEEGTRNYIIVSGGVAFLLAVMAFFSVYETQAVYTSDLKECNLLGEQKPGAINLLFFSDKKDAEKYKDYFLETSPFDKNKNLFNFFYIPPNIHEPECELYKGIALLCQSKELEKVAASCPHDFITVINNKEGSSTRSSALGNLMSINRKHPLSVLAHEAGHVIANFAEEYDAGISPPRGSKNCVSDCKNYEGETDGCYSECSDPEHFRSIEEGVMRTLSSNNYGIYNSNLLQEIINKKTSEVKNKITGAAILEEGQCSDKTYVLLEAEIKDKSVEIKDLSLQKGCAPQITGANKELYYKTLINGEELSIGEIGTTLWTDYHLDEETGGETYDYEGKFYVSIPEINSREIQIIDKETNQILAQSEIKVNRPCQI